MPPFDSEGNATDLDHLADFDSFGPEDDLEELPVPDRRGPPISARPAGRTRTKKNKDSK